MASQFTAAELYFGHGTDNPWDEAVALVTQLLHLPPDAEKRIGDCRLLRTERQAILQLASQRISERKPLPYLLHSAWFGGHEFYVDERVLIPRSPFAELLANNLEPYVSTPPKRILDMCTGSGCIAIVAAMTFPEAEVDAVDISPDALEVAQLNIEQHGLEQRVFPILSDGYDALAGARYDLIVTNPPYVDAEDMADLPDEYRHEPELGLASGIDGLALTRRILREAAAHLTDGGVLVCEVGNSMVQLQQDYPEVGFDWLAFAHGGLGVFANNSIASPNTAITNWQIRSSTYVPPYPTYPVWYPAISSGFSPNQFAMTTSDLSSGGGTFGKVETAVEGLKLGAFDYILKPWDNEKLVSVVKFAVEENRKIRKKTIDSEKVDSFFIGKSIAIQKAYSLADKVAKTDANVLILGENGTGKFVLAHYIHEQSNRKKEPFVHVDLGSLSENIFESETNRHRTYS